LEGPGSRAAISAPGALPLELLEVVESSPDADPLPIADLHILGSACGVPEEELALLDPALGSVIDGAPRAA
jgi:hypothetical protein